MEEILLVDAHHKTQPLLFLVVLLKLIQRRRKGLAVKQKGGKGAIDQEAGVAQAAGVQLEEH